MSIKNVDHPQYYNSGKIEVIDFIEDQQLDFHRGNAVKYIARAGKKDYAKEVEDLQKAVWYLNRKIEQITGKDPLEEIKKKVATEVVLHIESELGYDDKDLQKYIACICKGILLDYFQIEEE